MGSLINVKGAGLLLVAQSAGKIVGMIGCVFFPYYINDRTWVAQEVFRFVEPGFIDTELIEEMDLIRRWVKVHLQDFSSRRIINSLSRAALTRWTIPPRRGAVFWEEIKSARRLNTVRASQRKILEIISRGFRACRDRVFRRQGTSLARIRPAHSIPATP
jgi:hypothetical protein